MEFKDEYMGLMSHFVLPLTIYMAWQLGYLFITGIKTTFVLCILTSFFDQLIMEIIIVVNSRLSSCIIKVVLLWRWLISVFYSLKVPYRFVSLLLLGLNIVTLLLIWPLRLDNQACCRLDIPTKPGFYPCPACLAQSSKA